MPAISRGKRPVRGHPVLSVADFERHLTASAALIAPADVSALVARTPALRERLNAERDVPPDLVRRARLALLLLSDHARGACPQIPYQTVSLLAAALLYYLAPVDVIPDFIPRVGMVDDALVLDLAWRLAQPGVQRYLDWKELSAAAAESAPTVIAMPPPVASSGRRSAKPTRRRTGGGRRRARRR